MSWSAPEKTSWDGVKKTSDSGKGSLYSKDNGKGDIDRSNHAHFHKDGVTTTKNGEKSTIYKSNRD